MADISKKTQVPSLLVLFVEANNENNKLVANSTVVIILQYKNVSKQSIHWTP